MKILEVLYYEDNDRELKYNKYWKNHNCVSIYVNEELKECFADSIYESINFKSCMEYLEKKYPMAKLVSKGVKDTGYDYMIFEIEE